MVYLLHLNAPFRGFRHYIGVVDAEHGIDRGATDLTVSVPSPLVRAALAAGHTFVVADIWAGGRARAKELRARHEAPRLCSLCLGDERAWRNGSASLPFDPPLRAFHKRTDRTGGGSGDRRTHAPDDRLTARRKLSRQGNSLMVAVPRPFMLSLRLLPCDYVTLILDHRVGGFIVRPEQPRTFRPEPAAPADPETGSAA